ncbi:CoA pyrophosphatase [Glycomyces sp. TRM65418]|uniref:NUDIX hydrolase n=1 Tax=Glycomyces sp. TRM65418 TaxID=2867006 RepID=UPI001CE5C883|nr:CoA pyrophosphatase [Glycomyces sp. TRM65418]MCC3763750.1 CoA pyrophosphatase [Glycomyces sp. TRM65418]QZD53461.1 CoA pyrophosphatase [Glycomyces sp. TRM65418]
MERRPQWWPPLLKAAADAEPPRIGRVIADHLLPYEEEQARSASVLVLLKDDPDDHGPSVLLQQRAASLRHHPGEVAFPGGAAEPGDADAAATALREAAEELAVEPDSVAIGQTLPRLWIPVSGFAVTPVLALWLRPHTVAPQAASEVAAAHQVPLPLLADPANRGTVRYPSGRSGPCFQIAGVPLIWGFTAGVLSWLLDLGGWARPWDTGRTMELDRR